MGVFTGMCVHVGIVVCVGGGIGGEVQRPPGLPRDGMGVSVGWEVFLCGYMGVAMGPGFTLL